MRNQLYKNSFIFDRKFRLRLKYLISLYPLSWLNGYPIYLIKLKICKRLFRHYIFYYFKRFTFGLKLLIERRNFRDYKYKIIKAYNLQKSSKAYVTFFFFAFYKLWYHKRILFLYTLEHLFSKKIPLYFFEVSFNKIRCFLKKFSRAVYFTYLFFYSIRKKYKRKINFRKISKPLKLKLVKKNLRVSLWNSFNTKWYKNVLLYKKLLSFHIKKFKVTRKWCLNLVKYKHLYVKFFKYFLLKKRLKFMLNVFCKKYIYKNVNFYFNLQRLFFNEFFFFSEGIIPLWKTITFNRRSVVLKSNVKNFLNTLTVDLFFSLENIFLKRFSRYFITYWGKRINVKTRWWLELCSYTLGSRYASFLKFKFYSISIFYKFLLGLLSSVDDEVFKFNCFFKHLVIHLNYKPFVFFVYFIKKISKRFNYIFLNRSSIFIKFNSFYYGVSVGVNLKDKLKNHLMYLIYNFCNLYKGLLTPGHHIFNDNSFFLTPYKYGTRYFGPMGISILKEYLKVTTITVKELLNLPQRSHSFIKRKEALDLKLLLNFDKVSTFHHRSFFRLDYYKFSLLFLSFFVDFRNVFVARCIGGFFHKALGQFFLCFDYGFKKIVEIPLIASIGIDKYKIESSSVIDSQFYVFFIELLKRKFYKIYNRVKKYKIARYLDWNDFLITEEYDPLKKGPTMKEKFSLKLINDLYEVLEFKYSFKKQIELHISSFLPFFFSSLNSLNFIRFFNKKLLYKGVYLSPVTLVFYFKRFVSIKQKLKKINFPKLKGSNFKFLYNLREFEMVPYILNFLFGLDCVFFLNDYTTYISWFITLFFFFFFVIQHIKQRILLSILLLN